MSKERIMELAETVRSAFCEIAKIRSESQSAYMEFQKKGDNVRHELELLQLNPFQSYKVVKHYQELLRSRRMYKSVADIANQYLSNMKYTSTLDMINRATVIMANDLKSHEKLVFDSGLIKKILAAEEVAVAKEEVKI